MNDKVTISDIAILQTSSTTVLLYMPKDNFFLTINARESEYYQVARIATYYILINQMLGSETSSAKRLPDMHMLLITDPSIIGSINSCGIKEYKRVWYNHEFFVMWVFTG